MSDWKQVGKNEDGVPILKGSHKRPPLDSSLTILVLSIPLLLIMLSGLCLITISVVRGGTDALPPASVILTILFMLIVGLRLSSGCIRTLRLRRALKRSYPLGELGVKMRAGPRTVQTYIQERGIKPRYIVNGQPFYDLSDLGDADLLLRPVIAAHDENLLRPAAVGDADSENLLRAAQDQEASHDAMQSKAGRL